MDKKKFKLPENSRRKAYEKYVDYKKYDVFDHMGCGSIIWFMLFAWNTLLMGMFTPGFDKQDVKEYKVDFSYALNQRVRDVFYPISNGWYTSLTRADDDSILKYNVKYRYDETAKGAFKPRAVWYINIACLLVAAYWAFVTTKEKLKQNRTNKKQEAVVDMMLKLPFVGFDEKEVRKLMPVASEIVLNMSRDRRVYFDSLVDSDFSGDVKRNSFVRNMAIDIMIGHLKAYPEDLKKAIDVCNDNMIDKNTFMAKMKQKQR
ncbi:MAG: hypothetical protein J6S57_02495 [Alphaproteobacteria bacterium]|nr:hypothetical protein [Alphaproteobacteria bacterium]